MAKKKRRKSQKSKARGAQAVQDPEEDLKHNPFSQGLKSLKRERAREEVSRRAAEEAEARAVRERIKAAEAAAREVVGKREVLAGEVLELTEEELFARAVSDIDPRKLHSGKFLGRGPDTSHVRLKEERRPVPAEVDALEVPADPYHDDAAMFEEMMSLQGVSALENNTHVPTGHGVDLNVEDMYRFSQDDYSKRGRRASREEAIEALLGAEGPVLDQAQRKLLASYSRDLKKGAVVQELLLRGETREVALRQLELCVLQAGVKGERFIKVVTGKGLGSAGEPVLKQAVVSWCLGPGADLVTDYAPELLGDGTFGSLIVGVKRRRRR